MKIKNTQNNFGIVAIALHWLMAIVLTGLFAVGLYMTHLEYYDFLYHSLPYWHKRIGILMIFALIVRALWKIFNVKPDYIKTYKNHEIILSFVIHNTLYILILIIGVSGYLVSTGQGKSIVLFNALELPSVTQTLKQGVAELMGEVHYIAAIVLASLVCIHAIAALKHHYIDKDITLKRMLNTNTHEHN